jgi:hypothetical protein
VSKVLKCDCTCHDDAYTGYAEITSLENTEGWEQVGYLDICDGCLSGTSCNRWQPRVIPEPTATQKLFEAYYSPRISTQLQAEVAFLKMFNGVKK